MTAADKPPSALAGSGELPWTAWRPLPGMVGTNGEVLAETLDGGQAFRWYRQRDDTWLGVWGEHVVRIRTRNANAEWSAPMTGGADDAAVARYFGAEANFPTAIDVLPWRSDPHLARCMRAFPGLRILRQPFGETLLCFLCSATKQIVQIKQMVALLAERLGQPIATVPDTDASGRVISRHIHALPTWERLAEVPERDLRDCLLGFRAKYIAETARVLAKRPGWLDETEALPYAEAKVRLCELPGVGEKIADCVLLFGAGRLEAFPVDVWILRTLAQRYALHGWKPAELSQFGRVHFGANAGLAQQFLFAWERRVGRHEPQSR